MKLEPAELGLGQEEGGGVAGRLVYLSLHLVVDGPTFEDRAQVQIGARVELSAL